MCLTHWERCEKIGSDSAFIIVMYTPNLARVFLSGAGPSLTGAGPGCAGAAAVLAGAGVAAFPLEAAEFAALPGLAGAPWPAAAAARKSSVLAEKSEVTRVRRRVF